MNVGRSFQKRGRDLMSGETHGDLQTIDVLPGF